MKELGCRDGKLVLTWNREDWCQVVLLAPDAHTLGADRRAAVFEHLRRGLQSNLSGAAAGAVDGVAVRWVLSLAEHHASIYDGNVDGARTLFFQNADAQRLARLRLDEDERRAWIVALT